jgi:GNAT superfamily N-acetyltransferase
MFSEAWAKATLLEQLWGGYTLEVRIRPARPSDKEPLMSFIRNVWGGHDYIPKVWDEWIADDSGKMFVLEADGRPVAMNRVRFLDDGSAWFEGVRVHPDFRGKGLATMLGNYSMRLASRKGITVFRLTSNSRNRSSHRQVARMGFKEVARFSVYEPRGRMKFVRKSGVRKASAADIDMVFSILRATMEWKLGGGVMWDGFTAISLTPELLVRLVRDGSIFLLDGAVTIARPGREGHEVWTQVCFAGGDPVTCMKLVEHVLSSRSKLAWKPVYVPRSSPLIGALRLGGFRRALSMILFERKTANG